MGVRRTSESGVDPTDDVDDSEALRRRVGVRGLSVKEDSDANRPNTRGYIIRTVPISKKLGRGFLSEQ